MAMQKLQLGFVSTYLDSAEITLDSGAKVTMLELRKFIKDNVLKVSDLFENSGDDTGKNPLIAD